MIFDKPIPFAEALAARKGRELMPTSAGSDEISKLGPDILSRATFSARLALLDPVAKLDQLITQMTSPAERAANGLGAIDAGTFRLEMRAALARSGYVAPEGKEGSLLDHTSDARLNLMLKMNLDSAYGYGQYVQAQDPDMLDLWPCQELIRVEGRKVPREWEPRWVAAGGKLYGGRMIARKDSPVWSSISRFRTPYPPFDFGSGMGVQDVMRKEAEDLGVIKRSDIVKPDSVKFTDKVEAAIPQNISSGLLDALKEAFKGLATVTAEKIIMGAA